MQEPRITKTHGTISMMCGVECTRPDTRDVALPLLQCGSESGTLNAFAFLSSCSPTRYFPPPASATHQGLQNWSVDVSRLAGRHHSVHALPRAP
jgi:hypothetical protein